MSNASINIEAIKKVAKTLGPLNQEVVYVGGAVVSLYINEPAADDVRPTRDVDITLKIASMAELEQLRKKLTMKGFSQTPEDDVICRFRVQGIKVDVMATIAIGWAPANLWFEPGFDHLESVAIENENVKILSLPYFLASKYSAFEERGSKDPRTSHDLEDIVYILDNRTDVVEVIAKAPKDVLTFLKATFAEILGNEVMKEAILSNLYYETQTERFEMIIDKMNRITRL